MTKYGEQIIWTLVLLFLFFLDTSDKRFSFCLFKLIGFKSCFGCGIGHAIHYVLHLQFQQSFREHILGLPATIGIFYIISKPFILLKRQKNGSTANVYDVARTAA
jgi:hypothetical protein